MAAATLPAFLEQMNDSYERLHKGFEGNFWATKMNLKGNSTAELTKTKNEYAAFLGNADHLATVREHLKAGAATPEQEHVLRIMEKTFQCYTTGSAEADRLKEQLTALEGELEDYRGKMPLGYTDPATGEFHSASSVQLRTLMRTEGSEAVRKACYEGMASIGPYIAEKFLEVVKLRNRFAKQLGYVDFYDYKVTQAEGFDKAALFKIMDDLEQQTRPILAQAREHLAKEKGPAALEPWNTGFMMAGETIKELDPYFPFDRAVGVWVQTFAGLGIHYKGATMHLDLLDRQGKYSNGFCHWPQPAWRRPDGTWVPSVANFTSLATPGQVGSGHTGLATLLHEGGHAAHFANINQPSPFFSQERAPMSVAYAENQSMFLDSLQGDAAWLGRFARNGASQVIPWEVIEKDIRATHPYAVNSLRAMLAVPYFEKRLYELPEAELSVEALLSLAAAVEQQIQGGASSRPLLSVPHILADEASCYYHGYVLAEMSVHQTRAHFLSTYGTIIDNPNVGRDLTDRYWRPGNGTPFLDLVKGLTGKPLSADAWVEALGEDLERKLVSEKGEYGKAVAAGPRVNLEDADLGMRVLVVDGDDVVCDSNDAGLGALCSKFGAWVEGKCKA